MKFRIDSGIFEMFRGLNIGIMIAKGIDNENSSEEVLKKIEEQEKEIRSKYNTETLSQSLKISTWRAAYSAFGGEPKKNRSSVENLYGQVLSGNSVRHINKIVDIYNFISLKHMLPVGGEDTDKVKGDIILAFAEASEPTVLLLGDQEPHSPHAGEVIYKDDISAICRRWNWREADRTKLTEETRNCVLVIEGLPPVTRGEVEAAINELKELTGKYCGGSLAVMLLNENKPECDLS